jgi:hypothetical protein
VRVIAGVVLISVPPNTSTTGEPNALTQWLCRAKLVAEKNPPPPLKPDALFG